MALYFIFFSQRLKLKANVPSAVVCSTISGAAGGFFGIGGPPMVPYFLSAVNDDKLAYLATIQFFFLMTNVSGVTVRAVSGIITWQLIIATVPGALGLLAGTWLGLKIVKKIRIEQMKFIIYIFLAVSGAVTIIQNL